MPWLELRLTIDAAAQPQAEAVLDGLGALAITLLDADADTPGEAAIFEPGVDETPLWPSLTLLALFDVDADRPGLRRALHAALPELTQNHVAFREVADQDWERAWMDQFQPMRFGRRLWIYPWNIEPPAELAPHPVPCPASVASGHGDMTRTPRMPGFATAVVVRLDPGLAFGTGSHATTALCLEWLDATNLTGATVIDYGCGSGVLAIAALKLGATCAIGVDHDPQALTAARDNAVRNGVAGQLSLCVPEDLPQPARCDVLVANILAQPLHALAPRFAALCQPCAAVALSGILEGQEHELMERYAACGFAELRATRRGGWVRIDAIHVVRA